MTDQYRLTAQEQIATAILAGDGKTTVAEALQLADDLLEETRGWGNGDTEPDPYRIDPDDLVEGEMVFAWDGPSEEYGLKTGEPRPFCYTSGRSYFTEAISVEGEVEWEHCRRARKDEIGNA